MHRRFHEDAAGAGAGLAAERERRAGDDVGGDVEVGVGEHDDRVLAAELELQARPRWAAAWIVRPIAVEPVNVTAATSVVGDEVGPGGEAVDDVEHAVGSPASTNASARRAPISGVIGDGLNTTALPAARAGAILRLARLSGKFHGVITATTPTGSSTEYTSGVSSLGNVAPVRR